MSLPIKPDQTDTNHQLSIHQRNLAQKKSNRKLGLILAAVVVLFFIAAFFKRWR